LEDCQCCAIWKVLSVLIAGAFGTSSSFVCAETAGTEYLQVDVAVAATPESWQQAKSNEGAMPELKNHGQEQQEEIEP